jgi:hypothetical protein
MVYKSEYIMEGKEEMNEKYFEIIIPEFVRNIVKI